MSAVRYLVFARATEEEDMQSGKGTFWWQRLTSVSRTSTGGSKEVDLLSFIFTNEREKC
jgi:hypothetical protein